MRRRVGSLRKKKQSWILNLIHKNRIQNIMRDRCMPGLTLVCSLVDLRMRASRLLNSIALLVIRSLCMFKTCARVQLFTCRFSGSRESESVGSSTHSCVVHFKGFKKAARMIQIACDDTGTPARQRCAKTQPKHPELAARQRGRQPTHTPVRCSCVLKM